MRNLPRRRLFISAVVAPLSLALSIPASAVVRTTPIDQPNYFEAYGDASSGDTIALPLVVDYGAGPQSSVTVSLGDCCSNVGGLDAVPVALQFANGDSLFANLLSEFDTVPTVFLSDPPQASRPGAPLTTASIFDFANMDEFVFAADILDANVVNGNTYGYGPAEGTARFQFLPLAGGPGSFELLLTCNGVCANIGFNLGGVSFSSDSFDPNNRPQQLYSWTDSTFDFRFLSNSSGVPEPRTWAMMLLGFAFVGAALRRDRVHGVQLS